ncbi:MAG: hydantoinase B/oxoprolinase family protein [Deltaproteobacteria bacterium]|nr:hydantoinase B/oxoprolinase family protein [Deltaproteobacteria bacterium]
MRAKVDPIVLEIINSKVSSIVEEMRVVLFHSGYSTVLRESEDGSAGLLDAQFRTVAASKKLPLHFASFSAIGEHLQEYYKADELEDGDVILFNHPYAGNVTHLSDTVTLMPVFVHGHLVAYTATLAHKPDLGGPKARSVTRDLWEEGLVMPPVKYYARGKVSRDIEKILAANSRTPVETLGDLRGQVAACQVGAHRLKELCERFGTERVVAGWDELMERIANRLRAALREMPDGVHEAEAALDHDGFDLERPLRVHVQVSKRGEKILFDFSRSEAQGKGPANATAALIKNTCYFGLMAITDANLPFNHGFVDVVKTRFREGTVVCPHPGTAVSRYAPLVYLTSDIVLNALGKFCSDKAVGAAGGGAAMRILGTAGSSGKSWILMELLDTALGATSSRDGISLVHGTLGVGQFRPGPIEIHETEFPVYITRFEVRSDSGGPGKFRGGLGCTREYRVLEEAMVPVRGPKGNLRSKVPPWGVFGGQPTRIGNIWVNGEEASEKRHEIILKPGDVIRVSTNGGGGYGNPLEREPELVLNDVLDGYVALERARDDYSVVINPTNLTIDWPATQTLRRALEERRSM